MTCYPASLQITLKLKSLPGGAKGIGFSFAKRLAAVGAKVVFAERQH